jgi:3-methylcrotonyl-CoA carboxylase beta subunit
MHKIASKLKFKPIYYPIRSIHGKVIPNQIDTDDATFKANSIAQEKLIADLRSKISKIKMGGGEKAIKRHLDRNKLLPRDRIDQLLDPG